jgi:hypothetical protein
MARPSIPGTTIIYASLPLSEPVPGAAAAPPGSGQGTRLARVAVPNGALAGWSYRDAASATGNGSATAPLAALAEGASAPPAFDSDRNPGEATDSTHTSSRGPRSVGVSAEPSAPMVPLYPRLPRPSDVDGDPVDSPAPAANAVPVRVEAQAADPLLQPLLLVSQR